TVRRSLPPGLEAVIAKALSKVPADRFATANEFAEALAHPERFDHRRRVRRSWLGAAAAVCLLATLLASASARGRRMGAVETGGARVKSLAVLPIENLTGDSSQLYLADGMTDQ